MHSVRTAISGFFDIGMVPRNEVHAIIVHGHHVSIRRAGYGHGWRLAGDTICEDKPIWAWRSSNTAVLTHYTNHRLRHAFALHL